MLFEVAIIQQPTVKEAEDGGQETLVFGPKAVIARDKQGATVMAVKDAGITVDPARMVVLIRPFV